MHWFTPYPVHFCWFPITAHIPLCGHYCCTFPRTRCHYRRAAFAALHELHPALRCYVTVTLLPFLSGWIHAGFLVLDAAFIYFHLTHTPVLVPAAFYTYGYLCHPTFLRYPRYAWFGRTLPPAIARFDIVVRLPPPVCLYGPLLPVRTPYAFTPPVVHTTRTPHTPSQLLTRLHAAMPLTRWLHFTHTFTAIQHTHCSHTTPCNTAHGLRVCYTRRYILPVLVAVLHYTFTTLPLPRTAPSRRLLPHTLLPTVYAFPSWVDLTTGCSLLFPGIPYWLPGGGIYALRLRHHDTHTALYAGHTDHFAYAHLHTRTAHPSPYRLPFYATAARRATRFRTFTWLYAGLRYARRLVYPLRFAHALYTHSSTPHPIYAHLYTIVCLPLLRSPFCTFYYPPSTATLYPIRFAPIYTAAAHTRA